MATKAAMSFLATLLALAAVVSAQEMGKSDLGPFVVGGAALYKMYKTRPAGSSPSSVLKLESEQRLLKEYSSYACKSWVPMINGKIPMPVDRTDAMKNDVDLETVSCVQGCAVRPCGDRANTCAVVHH